MQVRSARLSFDLAMVYSSTLSVHGRVSKPNTDVLGSKF